MDTLFEAMKRGNKRSFPLTIHLTEEELEWVRVAGIAMDKRFAFEIWDYDDEANTWTLIQTYADEEKAKGEMEFYSMPHDLKRRVYDTILGKTVAEVVPEPPRPKFEKLWDIYNAAWIDMAQYKYLTETGAAATCVEVANKLSFGDFGAWLSNFILRRKAVMGQMDTTKVFTPQIREMIDGGEINLVNAMTLASIPIERQDGEIALLAATMSSKTFATYVKGLVAS